MEYTKEEIKKLMCGNLFSNPTVLSVLMNKGTMVGIEKDEKYTEYCMKRFQRADK